MKENRTHLRGLGSYTPEQRKAVFAKRRLTMIEKYGSYEAYCAAMRSYGSKGGSAKKLVDN